MKLRAKATPVATVVDETGECLAESLTQCAQAIMAMKAERVLAGKPIRAQALLVVDGDLETIRALGSRLYDVLEVTLEL